MEGGDGSGKSTQIEMLRDHVKSKHGVDPVMARDPGSTEIGNYMRAQLAAGKLSREAEVFGFMTARAQLVQSVIIPALEAGKLVLCDRFSLSTLIYQGVAGNRDVRHVAGCAMLSQCGLQPAAYIVLEAPYEATAARRGKRKGDEVWTYEEESFAKKTAAAYLMTPTWAPMLNSPPMRLVDASGDLDTVTQAVQAAFNEVFAPWNQKRCSRQFVSN